MSLKYSYIFFITLLLFCATLCKSQSNEGTSFLCTFMPHVDALINQRVIMVTSKYNTQGVVNARGVGISKKFTVVANVATIIKVNELVELVDAEKVTNQGIQITTELPCAVYIHQYSDFRSEASIVLPENALGTSYFTIAYFGKYSRNQVYPSQFAIIGSQDNTEVTIVPSTNTKTGYQKGQSFNVVLNRGETYMVQASLESEDITGSYITSTKPIAVFAGNPWTGVPQECSNWDNLLEQMIPINAWGKQFVSAPSAFTSYDLFRILASEDNTNVSINGVVRRIDKGQFLEYQSNQSSYVKADKPIMVAQYLVGGKCNGHSVGDPSMLLLNSIEQNRDTVILYNSPLQSITENYINLIVQTDDIDNTTIDGVAIVNLAIFREVVNGTPYSYLTLKVSDGSHLIINRGCGVIASAYGYGPAESYAYAGGANFRPINATPIIEGACVNEEALFDAGLDSAKVNISWDFGDGNKSNKYKPVHSYKEIGTFKVVLVVENLCLMTNDTFTKNIEITSQRKLIVPGDTLICERDSLVLKAVDENSNANFVWVLPNGSELKEKELKISKASNADDGSYSVKSIFKGCATTPEHVKVEIKSLPKITLGIDTTYCINDPPFLISLNQYKTILWSDGTSSNSYLIDKPQSLSVQVSDEFGCKNADTITIQEFCPTKFYLPNVFSPNDDNLNDFFEAKGINITTYSIAVYDRWGNLLYNGPKWDGTFNGIIVSNGIYAYQASYDAAVTGGSYEKRTVFGHVLVAR